MGETQALAAFVVNFPAGSLPAETTREATRSVLNWLGCAVGASRHATVEKAFKALSPFAGTGQASLLGRTEQVDVLTAALINGMSSHTFDFDDTHLRTVIHPSGPVASALLAMAEYHPMSGAAFLEAFALGVEVECRIGNAVYPSHYDIGWHITGTTGVFGAAAAVGRILGLDEERMTWALGIAATQASGLREMFGTMSKPFHPGNAARSGLVAAYLAQEGFTSSTQAIEAKRGFANVLATARNYDEITQGLGKTWELMLNSYKPFACGIVIHPTIDACIQLSKAHALKAEDVDAIELEVHPLVLELTGKTSPRSGLEGKFSVYHCAAVSLIDHACGESQFADERVADDRVMALRSKVNAVVVKDLHEDQVRAKITLKNGDVHKLFVEHAIGSVDKPMTDDDLASKFSGLVEPVLGKAKSDALLDLARKLADAPQAASLAQAARAHAR